MNIIITGASRGIGYELVKLLGVNTCHSIIAISRDEAKLEQLKKEAKEQTGSSNIFPLAFDLSQIESHKSTLLQMINKHFAHVDIVINNAGYLKSENFDTFNMNNARHTFEINYFAPALLIHTLLPLLKLSKQAHVVNIGSMGGFQGSSKFPGLSHYSASKAAIASLSECLAEEYKEQHIKFNCLALGSVQTEMLNEAFPGFKAQLQPAEMADFIAEFALNGHRYYNGKVLPVAGDTP